ncbi:MAG: hypothetical protein WA210_24300 [Burkholderiaceae bacterium]
MPKPGMRASGLPSPVLKLAWQRRQTYIFELDIIGLIPAWLIGRAAVYSACVWRNLSPASIELLGGVRRMDMFSMGWVAMATGREPFHGQRSCDCPFNRRFALAGALNNLTQSFHSLA